ncbi:sulfatase family protein [Arthrobacter cryoconiti]|uniref:Sulfatase n=1 Tax=Arthrobacter cryoconiti TaxID=748907 RepID=A0ABV8R4F7_9MICC|nr:sulfatase [Arthrobacter cryoconiti]MCC9066807.1 sulfatase [Arthrobacter cryoconiti]
MAKTPNLLFIVADQFRAMCVELGGDAVSTPFLDAMASDGVSLANAVSNYPVCSPHRAMMMSGQYPSFNGVTYNVNSETAEWGVGLRPDAPSWAGVLRDAGYNTGYIGKWHLEAPVSEDAIHGRGPLEDGRYWDAYSPLDRRHGFDFWYSYGCCDDHLSPHYWTGDAARHQRVDVTGWSAAHETDMAIDFLHRAAGANRAPFALAVSWNPPHQPFDQLPDGHDASYAAMSPAELLTRPNVELDSTIGREAATIAPLYYAAVSAIDTQVGRLMQTLDELNLTADTLVIFTSDHGQQMGSHELLYKNVPFEESMRIPFILKWPGKLRRDPAMAGSVGLCSVDIAPTLLGLLGYGGQVPSEMQGADVSGALLQGGTNDAGQDAPPSYSALYFYYPRDETEHHVRGLRTATDKFIARFNERDGLSTTLYDLAVDPFELVSVSDPERIRIHAVALQTKLAHASQTWPGEAALAALAEGR